MKLLRPICFFDIESATRSPYPDPAIDKIVVLVITKIHPEGERVTQEWRFNPGFEMSPENIAIHGITNEMAVGYPTFDRASAVKIANFICNPVQSDLAGFGVDRYDVPILWEEMFRVGLTLELKGIHVVDAGAIFKKKEERSLSAAVKFYCGREHIGAHDAKNDVTESINVLESQLERYADLAGMDVPALAKFSQMDDRLDLAGIIVRNKDGHAVFNTKRNKGVRVVDDTGYAEWMLRSDFSQNTKAVIRSLLEAHFNPESDPNQRAFL